MTGLKPVVPRSLLPFPRKVNSQDALRGQSSAVLPLDKGLGPALVCCSASLSGNTVGST